MTALESPRECKLVGPGHTSYAFKQEVPFAKHVAFVVVVKQITHPTQVRWIRSPFHSKIIDAHAHSKHSKDIAWRLTTLIKTQTISRLSQIHVVSRPGTTQVTNLPVTGPVVLTLDLCHSTAQKQGCFGF